MSDISWIFTQNADVVAATHTLTYGQYSITVTPDISLVYKKLL